jgi:hypothetical protein
VPANAGLWNLLNAFDGSGQTTPPSQPLLPFSPVDYRPPAFRLAGNNLLQLIPVPAAQPQPMGATDLGSTPPMQNPVVAQMGNFAQPVSSQGGPLNQWQNGAPPTTINSNPAGAGATAIPGDLTPAQGHGNAGPAANGNAPDMTRGTAPDPAEYAKRGEYAKSLMTQPGDTEAGAAAAAGGVLYDASQLAQFKRGWPLDAQHYGGSHEYANYAFGVYNATAGRSLSDALDMADVYGKHFSTYDPNKTPMDAVYTHIPASNVAAIKNAYSDYNEGTLYKKP